MLHGSDGMGLEPPRYTGDLAWYCPPQRVRCEWTHVEVPYCLPWNCRSAHRSSSITFSHVVPQAAPPGPFLKVTFHLGHAFSSCCSVSCLAGPQQREVGSEVVPDSDCVVGLVQKLAALMVEHHCVLPRVVLVAGTGCKCE